MKVLIVSQIGFQFKSDHFRGVRFKIGALYAVRPGGEPPG